MIEPSTSRESVTNTSERDKAIALEVASKIGNLVKIAQQLPKRGDDYELCNSFSNFNAFMQQQEVRIQTLITRCIETSGCPVRAPMIGSSLETYTERIMNANDSIIERVGICLDVIDRAHRDDDVQVPNTIIGAESTKAMSVRQPHIPYSTLESPLIANLPALLKAAKENQDQMKLTNIIIARPQSTYNITVDNSRKQFASKLRIKHNARKAVSNLKIIDIEDSSYAEETVIDMEDTHPYRVEYDHFKIPDRQLESAEPIKYKSLEETTLTYVNTKEGLENLRNNLNNQMEFAVDLEHNDLRTFLGLTCLVQISTRTTDYIIDPFPIWDEMHILNEPFTNPNILKVFHGAALDIQWLQRDFGIYVINLFDTYCAMKRLEMTKFSLQFLVQTFCKISLNKQYQTSDWRIRPLAQEQLDYARCDTHYLLYCFDMLREELLKKGNDFKNLLNAIYSDSILICRKPYVKPEFDPMGYEHLLNAKRAFNSQQAYALRELWLWRDNVARAEDEGLNYVLPNHMMTYIAEALPREAQGIAACCNPVPEMVRKHVLDIHRIVYKARDQPLILGFVQKKNIMGEEGSFLQALIDVQNRMTKIKSILRCNLDFSHTRYDEEIGKPSFPKDIEVGQLKAAADSSLCFTDTANGRTIIVPQTEKTDNKILEEIMNELEQWASPYERYAIGVKKATEQEAKKKEEEERLKKESGVVEEKTSYSHHDPVNVRPKDAPAISVNVENIELVEKNIPTFTEEMILTKKALARKRKQSRKAADIKFSSSEVREVEEGEISCDNDEQTSSKKIKHPVDYSTFDQNMFNKKPNRKDISSFGQQSRGKEKGFSQKRSRGRGGSHGRSTTFKPH